MGINAPQISLAKVQEVAASVASTATQGKSAYQCALDEGFVGTKAEWVASLSPDVTTDLLAQYILAKA